MPRWLHGERHPLVHLDGVRARERGRTVSELQADAPWAVGATVEARLLAESCTRVGGRECESTLARSVVATNPGVWRLEYDWSMASQLLVAIAPGTGGVTAIGPDQIDAPLSLEAVAPAALGVSVITSSADGLALVPTPALHVASGSSTPVLVSVLGGGGESLRGSFPLSWTTDGPVALGPALDTPTFARTPRCG